MRTRKGFSTLEILIALIILSSLIGASIGVYKGYIEKAKSMEAVVNVAQIQRAEEAHKLEKGTYVGADNIDQINELLGLDILPKYYEYRVVGVTEDDFIVLAQRISDGLEAGKIPLNLNVIAMNKTGAIKSGYQQYVGSGGVGGGSGGGSGGGETTFDVEGITSSSGGITIAGGVTSVVQVGGPAPPVVYAAEIQAALDALKSTTKTLPLGDSGEYYYNLIKERNIAVEYTALDKNILGMWVPRENKIEINESLQTEPDWPAEAIACIIAHEATHADYDYNAYKWIERITELYGYTEEQLVEEGLYRFFFNPETGLYEKQPVIQYSLTEEYFCFYNEAEVWKELKNGYTNWVLDYEVSLFDQGEAAVRADLRTRSSYTDLPEFFKGN
ncbi:MAG: hypothetical protein FJZ11_01085 [Candidatus Omnitrophica bacterium]|nr:hypothetical protein [Candidatus Omnitrophota bacterium]